MTATLTAPRWRAQVFAVVRARYALAAGAAVIFAGAAALIYVAVGSRHTLASRSAVTSASSAPAAMTGSAPAVSGDKTGQSMDAAVAGLEARLARQGGSADDWELLAKAYEFLGRTEDAKRARAHLVTPSAGAVGQMSAGALAAAATAADTRAPSAAPSAPSAPPPSLDALKQRVKSNPRDAAGWLALADLYRAQHDDAPAREALEKVIALNAMTAQSWADYADVLASLAGGSLSGAAGTAIDKALALDPKNTKALWLKASQAHDQHRYAEALVWWQKLRAALPPDSPDARVIDANIAEDTSLGGGSPTLTATATPATGGVSGTVSVDASLAARIAPNAVLFIYAKAADSPGPPLAVMRTTPTAWPVSFHLDDSMAMIPSRRLSQFDKVIVEARISRSGQAIPSSGDLYVTSPVMRPDASKKLALVINKEIG